MSFIDKWDKPQITRAAEFTVSTCPNEPVSSVWHRCQVPVVRFARHSGRAERSATLTFPVIWPHQSSAGNAIPESVLPAEWALVRHVLSKTLQGLVVRIGAGECRVP